MKIKDLSSGERPRERLLSAGPGALSDGELLAVILRSGTSTTNVLDLARSLLRSAGGSLVALSKLDAADLCRVPGIKGSKAAVILAAFELGRRFADQRSGSPNRPVIGARDIYELMVPYLKGLKHEECWVLLLDRRQRLMRREKVGSGIPDAVLIDPRSIVGLALRHGACSIVLVHNHPSGVPEPSKGDIDQTEKLLDAAQTCGLCLLDHVIVSDDRYFSFTDEKIYDAV